VSGRRIAVLLLTVVVISVVVELPAQAQCAMCRTALENSPEGRTMAASFNRGILLLLAVPYAILGTVGVVVFRAYRRKQAAERRNNPYIPKG
jgi:heme/copper-type cytochrome/quinol oxidase subunit 2